MILFRHATSVKVVAKPFTDIQAERLKGLTQLRVLSPINTPITDAGLMHLRGMHELRELSLENARITETGLTHLREMKNLKYLILDGMQTIGPGLAHLREMKQLVYLSLKRTPINDDSLRAASTRDDGTKNLGSERLAGHRRWGA